MLAALLIMTSAPLDCAVPEAEVRQQLSEPYDRFDVDAGRFGWRQLIGNGCVDVALQLLDRYGEAHASALSTETRGEMAFHAGQALLMSGRRSEAVAPLRKSLAIGGTGEWTTYVTAHLAFAEHDDVALKEARDRYARLSPGSMRLTFLDGMLACPTKSYMETMGCRR